MLGLPLKIKRNIKNISIMGNAVCPTLANIMHGWTARVSTTKTELPFDDWRQFGRLSNPEESFNER